MHYLTLIGTCLLTLAVQAQATPVPSGGSSRFTLELHTSMPGQVFCDLAHHLTGSNNENKCSEEHVYAVEGCQKYGFEVNIMDPLEGCPSRPAPAPERDPTKRATTEEIITVDIEVYKAFMGDTFCELVGPLSVNNLKCSPEHVYTVEGCKKYGSGMIANVMDPLHGCPGH